MASFVLAAAALVAAVLLLVLRPRWRTTRGVAAAPETFLVDAHGVVRWKKAGALTDATVQNELLPMLQQLERER